MVYADVQPATIQSEGSIIRHEKDKSVLGLVRLFQCLQHLANRSIQSEYDGPVALPWIRLVGRKVDCVEGVIRRLPYVGLSLSFVTGRGEMRRIERQVTEPRTSVRVALGTAMASKKIDCRFGKNIADVLTLTVKFFRAMIEIVAFAIIVMVVIQVAGSMSDEFVKPPLGGTRSGREPNIPFAEAARHVGRGTLFENLR